MKPKENDIPANRRSESDRRFFIRECKSASGKGMWDVGPEGLRGQGVSSANWAFEILRRSHCGLVIYSIDDPESADAMPARFKVIESSAIEPSTKISVLGKVKL